MVKKIYILITLIAINACQRSKVVKNITQINEWEEMEYNQDSLRSYSDTIYESLVGEELFLNNFVKKNSNIIMDISFRDTIGIRINNIIVVKNKDNIIDTVVVVWFMKQNINSENSETKYYYSLKNGIYAKLNKRVIFLYKKTKIENQSLNITSDYENYIKYILMTGCIDSVFNIEIPQEQMYRIVN